MLPSAQLPKALSVKSELSAMLRRGDFGGRGEPFLTTRALSERFGVALKTAHKIMQLLRADGLLELSGKRSLVALAPERADKKERVVGVMVTNLENPFFASLVKEIENQAARRGWQTVVVSTSYSPEREASALAMFDKVGVDGVLACPSREDNRVFGLVKKPLVFMARRVETVEADAVLVHNYAAGQEAARHLAGQGYGRFAYLGLKEIDHDQRLGGFRDQLERLGLKLDASAIFQASVANLDSASAALSSFLKKSGRPVGFFCFHDLLASSLLRLCLRSRVSVPEEAGIVGFDNLPLCTELHPALSSLAYPISGMAAMALDALARRMEGSTASFGAMHIEAELLARESSRGAAELAAAGRGGGNREDLMYHAH